MEAFLKQVVKKNSLLWVMKEVVIKNSLTWNSSWRKSLERIWYYENLHEGSRHKEFVATEAFMKEDVINNSFPWKPSWRKSQLNICNHGSLPEGSCQKEFVTMETVMKEVIIHNSSLMEVLVKKVIIMYSLPQDPSSFYSI